MRLRSGELAFKTYAPIFNALFQTWYNGGMITSLIAAHAIPNVIPLYASLIATAYALANLKRMLAAKHASHIPEF